MVPVTCRVPFREPEQSLRAPGHNGSCVPAFKHRQQARSTCCAPAEAVRVRGPGNGTAAPRQQRQWSGQRVEYRSTLPRRLAPHASRHSHTPSVDASAASKQRIGEASPTSSIPRVIVYDLSGRVVDYEQAWAWQRGLLARAIAAVDAGRRGAAQAVLLLQHEPVYTLGAGSTTDNLRFPPGSPPIPLYRTERGGEVTYHGPGQLVMYPILDLQTLQPDLHWYLRQLEQVVIEALDSVSGLYGERTEGLTGVWVGGAKVAAIGVRAKRWVSYHGLALNVLTDLSPFTRIVPCGIADRPVTSVKRLLAQRLAEEDPFAPPPPLSLAAPYAASAAEQHDHGGGNIDKALAGTQLGDGSSSSSSGGSGMIPLAEATQEDLRRLLFQAGMSPLMLTDDEGGVGAAKSRRRSAEGLVRRPAEGLVPDDPSADDPFADDPFVEPSLQADPVGGGIPRGSPVAAAAAGNGGEGALGGGDGGAQGGAREGPSSTTTTGLLVRSQWSAEEGLLLREYACALLGAFEEVFGVELVSGDVADLEELQDK